MRTIWIDTTSGTWGTIEGLVVVHLETEDAGEFMAEMTDLEICEFGQQFGTTVEVTDG